MRGREGGNHIKNETERLEDFGGNWRKIHESVRIATKASTACGIANAEDSKECPMSGRRVPLVSFMNLVAILGFADFTFAPFRAETYRCERDHSRYSPKQEASGTCSIY